MNKRNYIVSLPRSGNHLCRFFIELLSEIPTYGCEANKNDKEIYKNVFPEQIPFNIQDYDKSEVFHKSHHTPNPKNIKKLLIIIRSPREIITRNNKNPTKKQMTDHCREYIKLIELYNNHDGKKLLLFYEDIITIKIEFINKLYDFLDINDIEKKKYVLENVDKLFHLSSEGKNRSWGGINSKFEVEYYYKLINASIKYDFDNCLNQYFSTCPLLMEKYNFV